MKNTIRKNLDRFQLDMEESATEACLDEIMLHFLLNCVESL